MQGETATISSFTVPQSFQSTLPMQGETQCRNLPAVVCCISIHSPYAGRDWAESVHDRCCGNFNPLSLCRERRIISGASGLADYISIHSPYAGRDKCYTAAFPKTSRFQSTLPMQGETAKINNILPPLLCILYRKILFTLFLEVMPSIFHK